MEEALKGDTASGFQPILPMYEPDAAVFDGRYELPPIRRVT